MTDTLTRDLATASAGELASALAARQVSAVELTDAAIARIERLDGAINAVVVRDFDRAREAAKVADAALARGERGALLGVPMTVKESHNIAGLPTTWGAEVFRGWMAGTDGVAISRLKAAGAVILGKTNVPPFLADWQSANPIYGRTRNPWDLERSPGGSSGGGAAAVAAGMVPLEVGSDIGGSIRVPAAFCGIYGHKPSYELLPLRGHAPPGFDGASSVLSVIGPMARTAADLDLALGVLAGPDGEQAKGYRLALPAARHARLGDFRVLMLEGHPNAQVDDEVAAAMAALAGRLEAAGVKVARGSDLLPDLAKGHETYMAMLNTAMSRRSPNATTSVTAHQWMALLDAQVAIRRQWQALFDSVDVVLAPAFGAAAFPHNDERDMAKRTLTINGRETPAEAQLAWAGMASLGCLPATAAPIGRTAGGLPIGVQIISGYLEDRTTIAFSGLAGDAVRIAPEHPAG